MVSFGSTWVIGGGFGCVTCGVVAGATGGVDGVVIDGVVGGFVGVVGGCGGGHCGGQVSGVVHDPQGFTVKGAVVTTGLLVAFVPGVTGVGFFTCGLNGL